MRLSVHTFVSLDGVMQGPGAPDEDSSGGFDRGGWLVPHVTDESNEVVNGWYRHADAILLGRNTFESMRAYWSQVTDPDDLVATALNTWQKYVASASLSDADAAWGPTTVLRGDIVKEVGRLKERPGGELQVHGSWRLIRTLHDAGLVDTYRLLQFPVVVGAGKRLFAEGTVPATYRVDGGESRLLDGGALAMTLHRTRFRDIGSGAYTVNDGDREETVER